jgi:DUF1009 family protein
VPVAGALGVLAGRGRFPLDIVRAARRRGERVVVVGLVGMADVGLEAEADALAWVHVGEVQKLVDAFRAEGVERAVVAGKIPKTVLYDPAALRLDARAMAALQRLADRKDDSIQGALATELEADGIALMLQSDAAPDLFAGVGPLGRHAPDEAGWADVAFGWPVARAMGAHDIGQSVVIRERAVIAVEAIEGTDATIERAGALAPGGRLVIVKVAKPGQDPRFDMPAIGVGTLEAMLRAGAGVLAFEAGRTVVLERDAVVAAADDADISVVGVPSEGPA